MKNDEDFEILRIWNTSLNMSMILFDEIIEMLNDANQIRIQPFNNADMTQHWNIQKVKKIRL